MGKKNSSQQRSDPTTEKIRWVERTKLDQAYRRYALLHRDIPDALLAVCQGWAAIYDHIHHEKRASEPELTWRTILHLSLRALGHCIRWIYNHNGERLTLPKPSSSGIEREAAEFLSWAMQYEMLSIDHTAWSRGAQVARVDEREQMITFSFASDFDHFYIVTQQASTSYVIPERFTNYPYEAVKEGFHEWLDEGQIWNPLEARQRTPQIQFAYNQVVSWLEQTLFPEIPRSTDLLGYTVNDFTRLWAELHLLSEFAARAADAGILEPRTKDSSQGWLMIVPLSEFQSTVANSCGLTLKAVTEILKDLTFDPARPQGSLTEQPLIPFGRTRRLLIPSLVASANPWEVLTRTLTKGPRVKAFSRFSPELEKKALQRIAAELRNSGLGVVQEPEVLGVTGNKLTPDLLLFDRSAHAVVLEYKHALSPFGASEALSKIADVKKWIEKLQEYNAALLHGGKFPNVADWSSVLLLRWPIPVPLPRTPGLAIIDWASLSRWLNKRSKVSLRELVDWTHTRDDLPVQTSKFSAEFQEIRVGDWTYRRSILAAPQS